MSVRWTEAIAEYSTEQRAARRSSGTIKLHRHYLNRLAAQHAHPWTVTTAHLRAFLAVPTWSAETQKSARAAVAGFYRWAEREGYVDVDPSARLSAVTVPTGVARPVPEPVLRRALGLGDARERLMILIAAYAGLRCAEIARLHHDDLDGQILYVTGKGGKTRIVPVEHPEILGAFARADGYLFPGRIDGHLSAGYVSKLFGEALPDGWTGHKLRHRFATRSNAVNPDLLALGKVLGHSRPETTQRYVQVSQEALLRVVRGAA